MDPSEASEFKALLGRQTVAALATLHQSAPAVSMVPFALLPDGSGIVIHVSELAAHTKDMLDHPSVALLVMGSPEASGSALALPRVGFQGEARRCDPELPEYAQARAAYLARLPEAEELFTFADFSVFVIRPASARYVAGPGRAMTLTAETLRDLLGRPPEGGG
jgi:heme iron utilization protein